MRTEFDKPTKRESLKRSGGKCEAVGERYGLVSGQRCEAPLGEGFHFDHVTADSHGGKATLDNCACVCRTCHSYKTRTYDTPVAAKLKRISDKHNGIRSAKQKIPSRPFRVVGYVPNTKFVEHFEDADSAGSDSRYSCKGAGQG